MSPEYELYLGAITKIQTLNMSLAAAEEEGTHDRLRAEIAEAKNNELTKQVDELNEQINEISDSEDAYRKFVSAIYEEKLLDWCYETGFESESKDLEDAIMIDHAEAMDALIESSFKWHRAQKV